MGPQLQALAQEEGLILRALPDDAIGFCPPLIITEDQIDDLFDFDDPNWLRIEGLVEGEPVIERLTFRVVEDDAFVAGGRSPIPTGISSSSTGIHASIRRPRAKRRRSRTSRSAITDAVPAPAGSTM